MWTRVTYFKREEALEQDGLLFIRASVSEILDKGRYHPIFGFEMVLVRYYCQYRIRTAKLYCQGEVT